METAVLETRESELEKMLAGKEYDSRDPVLLGMRRQTRANLNRYNSDPTPENLAAVLGYEPENLTVVPPFQCEYGRNLKFGKNVFVNFNFSALTGAIVEVGDNCLIGPNVGIYTAMHPLDPDRRKAGVNFSKPVKIGANCWLGAGAIVLPGVEIGEGCTIGAGSVVTRDIPPRCVAAGNPCKILKRLDPRRETENSEKGIAK